MIINQGAFINNADSKVLKSKVYYSNATANRETTFVVFNNDLLIELFNCCKSFTRIIMNHSYEVEDIRLSFLMEADEEEDNIPIKRQSMCRRQKTEGNRILSRHQIDSNPRNCCKVESEIISLDCFRRGIRTSQSTRQRFSRRTPKLDMSSNYFE